MLDLFGEAVPVERRSSTGFTHESASAETVEWYTPEWIFEALGERFDLDVCAPSGGIPWLPAERYFALPIDGLAQEWVGFVWCNPPYGDEVGRWLLKLAHHGEGIALVFARTGGSWFHTIAPLCSAILFLKGRVKFVPDRPPSPGEKYNGPGADSMLVAFGDRAAASLKRAKAEGFLVDLRSAAE